MVWFIYKCVFLSYPAYKNRSIVDFPLEVYIEYEMVDSDTERNPFFIAIDSNIIGCRRSKCMNYFISNSLGVDVSFNGGKLASYIFL